MYGMFNNIYPINMNINDPNVSTCRYSIAGAYGSGIFVDQQTCLINTDTHGGFFLTRFDDDLSVTKVYELTTFLALKPDAKILVQPVILGPLAEPWFGWVILRPRLGGWPY